MVCRPRGSQVVYTRGGRGRGGRHPGRSQAFLSQGRVPETQTTRPGAPTAGTRQDLTRHVVPKTGILIEDAAINPRPSRRTPTLPSGSSLRSCLTAPIAFGRARLQPGRTSPAHARL